MHHTFDKVSLREWKRTNGAQTWRKTEIAQVKSWLAAWEWTKAYKAAATPRWDTGCTVTQAPDEVIMGNVIWKLEDVKRLSCTDEPVRFHGRCLGSMRVWERGEQWLWGHYVTVIWTSILLLLALVEILDTWCISKGLISDCRWPSVCRTK